jgi:hypothetical protein
MIKYQPNIQHACLPVGREHGISNNEVLTNWNLLIDYSPWILDIPCSVLDIGFLLRPSKMLFVHHLTKEVS